MATTNSVIYAQQIAAAGASAGASISFPSAKSSGGKLRIVTVPYLTTGSEATNDIINLTLLKPGSRILPAFSRVLCEALGTTFTVKVGDAANTERYMGAKALASATDASFTSTLPSGAAGLNVAYQQTGSSTQTSTTGQGPNMTILDVAGTAAATQVGGSSNETVVIATLTSVNTPTASKRLTFFLAIVDE